MFLLFLNSILNLGTVRYLFKHNCLCVFPNTYAFNYILTLVILMFILYILAVARAVSAMNAMVEDLRFFQMVLIKSLENQSKEVKKRGMMFLKQSNFFFSKHTYFLHFLMMLLRYMSIYSIFV